MGISIPSTQYIVALANFFGVSTDYLLELSNTATISVAGLSKKDIAAIVEIIQCLKEKGYREE